MRAEHAAALTNFLFVLLIAAGLMMAPGQSNTAHVYADPYRAAVETAAIVLFITTPLAAFASWRTSIHAQRYLTRETTGWQGVLEAGALGFTLTLPFVLPGVVARQFDPGAWGQPQAFTLGLTYVGAYGLLGLVVGLVVGFLLWLSAMLALLVHRRTTS